MLIKIEVKLQLISVCNTHVEIEDRKLSPQLNELLIKLPAL